MSFCPVQPVQKVMQEGRVIALQVAHDSAHPGEAFAEPQIISRIVLGRLASRPIPISSILDIHDVNRVVFDDVAPLLKPKIVHATDALLKDLWSHNGRTDGEDHPAIK